VGQSHRNTAATAGASARLHVWLWLCDEPAAIIALGRCCCCCCCMRVRPIADGGPHVTIHLQVAAAWLAGEAQQSSTEKATGREEG
jgi:hypothetical protein